MPPNDDISLPGFEKNLITTISKRQAAEHQCHQRGRHRQVDVVREQVDRPYHQDHQRKQGHQLRAAAGVPSAAACAPADGAAGQRGAGGGRVPAEEHADQQDQRASRRDPDRSRHGREVEARSRRRRLRRRCRGLRRRGRRWRRRCWSRIRLRFRIRGRRRWFRRCRGLGGRGIRLRCRLRRGIRAGVLARRRDRYLRYSWNLPFDGRSRDSARAERAGRFRQLGIRLWVHRRDSFQQPRVGVRDRRQPKTCEHGKFLWRCLPARANLHEATAPTAVPKDKVVRDGSEHGSTRCGS